MFYANAQILYKDDDTTRNAAPVFSPRTAHDTDCAHGFHGIRVAEEAVLQLYKSGLIRSADAPRAFSLQSFKWHQFE